MRHFLGLSRAHAFTGAIGTGAAQCTALLRAGQFLNVCALDLCRGSLPLPAGGS